MKQIKIGLVNGLNYYDYKDLINNFLNELHISYITSNKTTKKTIENGKKLLVDECCLSLKIFFGHICDLKDKCDYILVIRSPSIERDEFMCINFYALYDLANNIFPDKIIDLNIDLNHNINLKKSFINLGKKLGFNQKKCSCAFDKAYNMDLKNRDYKYNEVLQLLKSSKKKILLIGHAYNLFDNYISSDIKKILKDLNVEILLSCYLEGIKSDRYKSISKDINWSKNIKLLNVIMEFRNYIDGIILISTFPCAIDSLVNEMIIRKSNIPILDLTIDEINDIGSITKRIEEFLDNIKMEKKYEYKN